MFGQVIDPAQAEVRLTSPTGYVAGDVELLKLLGILRPNAAGQLVVSRDMKLVKDDIVELLNWIAGGKKHPLPVAFTKILCVRRAQLENAIKLTTTSNSLRNAHRRHIMEIDGLLKQNNMMCDTIESGKSVRGGTTIVSGGTEGTRRTGGTGYTTIVNCDQSAVITLLESIQRTLNEMRRLAPASASPAALATPATPATNSAAAIAQLQQHINHLTTMVSDGFIDTAQSSADLSAMLSQLASAIASLPAGSERDFLQARVPTAAGSESPKDLLQRLRQLEQSVPPEKQEHAAILEAIRELRTHITQQLNPIQRELEQLRDAAPQVAVAINALQQQMIERGGAMPRADIQRGLETIRGNLGRHGADHQVMVLLDQIIARLGQHDAGTDALRAEMNALRQQMEAIPVLRPLIETLPVSINGRADQLRDQITQIQEIIDTLPHQADLEEIRASLARLEGRLPIPIPVEAIVSNLTTIQEHMDQTLVAIQTMPARFDQLITTLNAEIQPLIAGLQTLREEITGVRTNLGTFRTEVGTATQGLRDQLTAQTAEIAALRQDIQGLRANTAAAASPNSNTNRRLAALSRDLTALRDLVSPMRQAGYLEPVLTAIAASQAQIQQTIRDMGAARHSATNAAALADLQSRLGDLDTLRGQVVGLTQERNAGRGEQERLRAELESVTAALAAARTNTNQRTASVRDLEAIVAERNARIRDLETQHSKLEAQFEELDQTSAARIQQLRDLLAEERRRLQGMIEDGYRAVDDLQREMRTMISKEAMEARLDQIAEELERAQEQILTEQAQQHRLEVIIEDLRAEKVKLEAQLVDQEELKELQRTNATLEASLRQCEANLASLKASSNAEHAAEVQRIHVEMDQRRAAYEDAERSLKARMGEMEKEITGRAEEAALFQRQHEATLEALQQQIRDQVREAEILADGRVAAAQQQTAEANQRAQACEGEKESLRAQVAELQTLLEAAQAATTTAATAAEGGSGTGTANSLSGPVSRKSSVATISGSNVPNPWFDTKSTNEIKELVKKELEKLVADPILRAQQSLLLDSIVDILKSPTASMAQKQRELFANVHQLLENPALGLVSILEPAKRVTASGRSYTWNPDASYNVEMVRAVARAILQHLGSGPTTRMAQQTTSRYGGSAIKGVTLRGGRRTSKNVRRTRKAHK